MTLLLSRRPLNVHAKQTVTGSGYRFCHQGARPNKPCPRHFLPNFMREQHGKQTCGGATRRIPELVRWIKRGSGQVLTGQYANVSLRSRSSARPLSPLPQHRSRQ